MRLISGRAVWLSAVLSGALIPAAAAQGFNYSFVDVGYAKIDYDDIDESADGYGLVASLAVTESLRLKVTYTDLSIEDIDLTGYSLGASYHRPVASNTDAVLDLAWIRSEADGMGLDVSNDGYGLTASLRHWLLPALEVDGRLAYQDISGETETSFNLGGLYFFAEAFALGASYTKSEHANGYDLVLRVNF